MAIPTRSDLETAIAGYDAIAKRDFEAMMRLSSPEGVLETRLETYRGREELRRYYEEIVPSDMTSTPQAFLLSEGGLVVLSQISMVGESSGIATTEKISELWEIEDGLIQRLKVMGRDEGLDAFDLHDTAAEIETLNRAYECFNRGDFEGALEQTHPDIVWNRGALMVGGDTLHGREAVRELLEPEVFENQQVELESIIARRDRMMAAVVFSARGAGSGIELSNRGYQVWTMRDGRACKVDFFQERNEGLDFLFEEAEAQELGDSGST